MFNNAAPFRNNVPNTGLTVPPPPLLKPMNYPSVQVRLFEIHDCRTENMKQ